jgi:hypothetical protein
LNAKPIKDLLSEYLKGTSLNKINETMNIERLWKIIVGSTISKNTEIIGKKKGILTIKTSNPIWRNELSLQKTELLKKIKAINPELNITEIKLK